MKMRSVTASQPTTVREWMEQELVRDKALQQEVEETLAKMRIEQDLVQLRERYKLSQAQLARRLGITQPAVAKLESGKADLKLRTLVRYAVALGAKVHIAITEGESDPGIRVERTIGVKVRRTNENNVRVFPKRKIATKP